MEDRAKLVELVTSQQVTDAAFFNELRKTTPLLAELMLDKFKSFLSDPYFTDIERQTTLMKYLEEQTDVDLNKDILKHIENSPCKDDYTKIIMEWTFHNSDNIINSNLAKFDGVGLLDKKPKYNRLEVNTDLTREVLTNLVDNLLSAEGEDFQ